MALAPSTPADRAPRLPRTRCHATSRNAGSWTRLNTSRNRRPESSPAQRCSLAWISHTRRSACPRVGHSSGGASVFTVDLRAFQHPHCQLAGSLRPADGFPALRLLRSLRPTRRPSTDDESARHCPGRAAGRATTGGSHVHHEPIDEGDAQLYPGRLATSTPQPFLVASSPVCSSRLGVARHVFIADAHGAPTQIHQVRVGSTLTGLHALIPLVHLLVSLAGPAPSGSADAPRRCQDCFPPSPASPGSGCPQLQPGCCDSPAARAFHPYSVTLAPRGARTGHQTGEQHPHRPIGAVGLDLQYPDPVLDRTRCVGVHWRPPDLPAPVLRTRCRPWPCGRLSRPRTTTAAPPRQRSLGGRCACPRPVWLTGIADASLTVSTFTTHRLTGWAPSSSPAASPRLPRSTSSWPPARPTHDLTEVTATVPPSPCAPLTGPNPSGSSRRSTFGGSTTGSCLRTPLRLTRPARTV